MINREKITGICFSIILVLSLLAPTIQGLFKIVHESTLYGYTDPIPDKPIHYISSFFDKSFQQWIEKKFNARLGFRAFLIRSFNEVNFRLFREANNSRLKLVSTKKHGLYSNLSIDSLNYDMTHQYKLEKEYQEEARQLLNIQDNLAAKGKYFAVVIASSKAYIYPQGLGKRHLVKNSKHIFSQTASFGATLKAAGVNVIDSGTILRHLAHVQKIETHPVSGLHWNYYAACVIAQEIISQAQQMFPTMVGLNCDPPQRIQLPLNDVDFDGYSLLNIWSGAGLLTLTTYPTITSTESNQRNWHPSMVVIGDSFSDQIRFAFKKAKIYSRMVMSSYFRRLDVEDQDGLIYSSANNSPFESKLLADIDASDIIILEMVDYNIHREHEKNLYGFAEYFLNYATA